MDKRKRSSTASFSAAATKKQRKIEEQKFLLEFLETYRTLPALWDVENNDYTNKIAKEKQNEELLAKYREFYDSATMREMKTKLNSIRTNYRAERKKVAESTKSDTGRDASGEDSDDGNRSKVYTSTKWYYECLNSFLEKIEKPSGHRSSMSVNSTVVESVDGDEEFIQDSQLLNEKEETQVEKYGAVEHPLTPSSQRKKDKKIENNFLQLACKHLSAVAETKKESAIDGVREIREDIRQSLEGDDYCLARGWANDVKKMNPDQGIWAKKFIRDIIVEGQLGQLHRHSVFINPPVIDTSSVTDP